VLDNCAFELLGVLTHENTPKVWTGVQLLGCSSASQAFVRG
jgi:hypothetical protein